jgi:RNA polymerase sigma-70 factor (ECF subfamily)
MARPLEGLAILLQTVSGSADAREKCFRRIWQDYYPRLRIFVRAQGGAAACEAEDIVQDVMQKVFTGMARYDPSWSFATWVYTIARNTCRDRARRERARPAAMSLSDIPAAFEPSHLLTPEQEFLRDEEEQDIERFFSGAEPDTRQIAFLRFHQRMRYVEIAAVMAMPVGTVKFRVHEIRRRLMLHLEDGDG